MKPARHLVLLVLLLTALPAAGDVMESAAPDGDCRVSCPGDNEEGKCPSSCDDCACCPRAVPAVIVSCAAVRTPERMESAPPLLPTSRSLGFVLDVFHPPRA